MVRTSVEVIPPGAGAVGRAGRAVALAAAVLLGSGCDAGQDGIRTTVRDSAGIAIVESTLPADHSLHWRVDPEPVRVIGVAEGPAPYQLYRVRDVTRLSDGSIALVNGGTNELRVFGPDGAFRGAVGGEGDGPGEFRAMRLAGRLRGDSLLLFDPLHARFSIVAPGPTMGTSFGLGSRVPEGNADALGVLADGRIAVLGPGPIGEARAATVLRPPRALMLLDGRGGLETTLDAFPDRPVYFEADGGFSFTFVPFAVPPTFAVGDRTLYAGTGDSYEVRAYGSGTGALARVIRLDRPPRPVTEADLDRFIQRALDRADPGGRPALRASYDAMPIPGTMPAYRRMLIDRAGYLWVADFRAHPGEPRRWTVFDPEGRALGTVVTPRGVHVHEIGDDWVLGVRRDELDIPYVVIHRLERGEQGRRRLSG